MLLLTAAEAVAEVAEVAEVATVAVLAEDTAASEEAALLLPGVSTRMQLMRPGV